MHSIQKKGTDLFSCLQKQADGGENLSPCSDSGQCDSGAVQGPDRFLHHGLIYLRDSGPETGEKAHVADLVDAAGNAPGMLVNSL